MSLIEVITDLYRIWPQSFYALLEQARHQPVVCSGTLVGSKAQQVLAADQRVIDARQRGDSAATLQALQASPATVLTMVLSLARKKSGYDPTKPASSGNIINYLFYLYEIWQYQIFKTPELDGVHLRLTGEWSSAVDQIAAQYQGLSATDVQHVRDDLWNLAKAASSRPDTNETENLFSQGTIHADSDISLFLCQSYIQMSTEVRHGGKHSPDVVINHADFILFRIILKPDAEELRARTPAIMNESDDSLRAWLKENSTPHGDVPVNW